MGGLLLRENQVALQDQAQNLDGLKVNDFQPVAFFDKHMDCIRVITHDRSVTEVRLDQTFTLHLCNRPSEGDPQYIGFTIKGIRHLFAEIGLPQEGVYRLADIFDKMAKYQPGSTMAALAYMISAQYQQFRDAHVSFDEAMGRAA